MTRQNGFTLIELAIALMVIGLLIGGVLKGQELIENAKVTAFMRELKAYDTAVMIFRNTYNGIPGDLRNPGSKIPDCTTTNLCVPTDGTQGDRAFSTTEEVAFWIQLSKAGMAGGTLSDIEVTKPTTAAGGYYRLRQIGWPIWTTTAPHTVPSSTTLSWPISPAYIGLSTRFTNSVDTKMDDGKPLTGDIQSTASNEFGGTYYNFDADACVVSNSVNEHNLANRAAVCTLNYGASSILQ